MIYLDNAATTFKKPPSVISAVDNALKNYSSNPGRSGHKYSQKAADLVYSCRKTVAAFFGFQFPENVIFTSNCTHSINTVIKGLDLSGGVVTSNLEHNAVMRPLYKSGADISVFQVGSKDETIENVKKQIKQGTSLVICTHVSNVFGIVLPIFEIGQLCREKGVLFAVDAAQSAGVLPLDVKKCNIDFLCCPGHKGLYGPMGTGILLSTGKLRNTLMEGGTGSNSISKKQPDEMPERFESGTLNVPGIAGIKAGIDFINNKGINNIYNHEKHLIDKAYDMLSRINGIKLYTDKNIAPVLSFNVNDYSSTEIGSVLNKNNIAVRSGLHCAPAAHNALGTVENGTVRISPSVFNSENDINILIKTLKNIINA